ncbi:MAG TPA: sensor histidine kinase [Candidatus Dormibacteraeota bacterium]|nr:sensor histidine kinase [Candidatus Dormibacteraeota bacterium]
MVTPLVVQGPLTRASERQAGVEEEVRRLVARELHDRVAQTLTGMLVDVENFKSEEVEWEAVQQQLETIQSSTRQVLANIRQLLHDLRGEELLNGGLVVSLRALLMRFEDKTGIEAQLEVRPGWPEAMSGPASLNVYRIAEEALSNVRMHSGASTVRVVLEARPNDRVALMVTDDGRGVDTDPDRVVGHGTVGMRERALFLDGELQIESAAGKGTTVHAVFPRAFLVAAPATVLPKLVVTKGLTA